MVVHAPNSLFNGPACSSDLPVSNSQSEDNEVSKCARAAVGSRLARARILVHESEALGLGRGTYLKPATSASYSCLNWNPMCPYRSDSSTVPVLPMFASASLIAGPRKNLLVSLFTF